MARYPIKLRMRKYIKRYGFCQLQEIYLTNMKNNYWILLQKQN